MVFHRSQHNSKGRLDSFEVASLLRQHRLEAAEAEEQGVLSYPLFKMAAMYLVPSDAFCMTADAPALHNFLVAAAIVNKAPNPWLDASIPPRLFA